MSYIVKIRNADLQTRIWLGQVIESNEYYTIPTDDLNNWANDSSLLIDIADGYAIVNDGSTDIVDVNMAINWLKGIVPQEKRTGTGVLLTATTKPDFSELKIYSPNLADKTTWYSDSVEVYETLTKIDAMGKKWSGKYDFWIDLTHGKIPQEHQVAANYIPTITVFNNSGEVIDGYSEYDPHNNQGDFKIDYRNGSIEFDDFIDGYITAHYYYATKFTVYITPEEGKQIDINRSEVQFTTDVDIMDTAVFQLYVYTAVIETAMGLPIGTLGPPGSRYPYGNPTKYKSAADYIAEANGNYPVCPAFGGSSWRGLKHPIITIPFEYTALKPLKSSLGTQVIVTLEHDEEFKGTYGTVTFYCHSKDEE